MKELKKYHVVKVVMLGEGNHMRLTSTNCGCGHIDLKCDRKSHLHPFTQAEMWLDRNDYNPVTSLYITETEERYIFCETFQPLSLAGARYVLFIEFKDGQLKEIKLGQRAYRFDSNAKSDWPWVPTSKPEEVGLLEIRNVDDMPDNLVGDGCTILKYREDVVDKWI